MSFSYLRVQKLDPKSWTDKYFEVRADGRVSRMVTVRSSGRAVSNSVEIMSHRSSAYADAAYGNGGPCIYGGFPAPDDHAAYWARRGCAFEPISAGEFHRQFVRAKPDLG